MLWTDAQTISPLYLNLGGKSDCHPHEHYENYVSVDNWMESGQMRDDQWNIDHDLTEPIPLPDNSVDRLHTEDFLHYLEEGDIDTVLTECYRVLKPGGFMRIALPDYNHPKDRKYAQSSFDPRYPKHKTITTRESVEEILKRSPFSSFTFLHFWEENSFTQQTIDYSKGWVRRTPDNDPRNSSLGSLSWRLRYLLTYLTHWGSIPPEKRIFLRGHPLFVTSLVVDCYKS